jgi:hypothetical protein
MARLNLEGKSLNLNLDLKGEYLFLERVKIAFDPPKALVFLKGL